MVPSVKIARLISIHHKAFSVVAPSLWHSLPLEACQALHLLIFRREVKTELNKIYSILKCQTTC